MGSNTAAAPGALSATDANRSGISECKLPFKGPIFNQTSFAAGILRNVENSAHGRATDMTAFQGL